MRRTLLGLALAAAVVGSLTAVACGNGAVDVAGCRELEYARCDRAIECGIDLAYPLHAGSSNQDAINACKEFYDVACLHGLVTSVAPAGNQLNDCLTDITMGSCNVVVNPQSDPGCSWLNPPDAGVDAAADGAIVYSTEYIEVNGTTSTIIEESTVGVVVTTSQAETTTVTVGDAGVDANGTDSGTCYDGCDSTCEGDSTCIMMCEETCQDGELVTPTP